MNELLDVDAACDDCGAGESECQCPVDCSVCEATGIGQFGDPDPDTSRCWRCGGRGFIPRAAEAKP